MNSFLLHPSTSDLPQLAIPPSSSNPPPSPPAFNQSPSPTLTPTRLHLVPPISALPSQHLKPPSFINHILFLSPHLPPVQEDLQRRRIVLPCSVEEYQVGQLYSVAEASKKNTGGGDGIEVLINEPYEKDGERGQYTHKIYYLENKVPQFIRLVAPEGSLVVHEKAWNAYPYCRTVVTNEYMKDDFFVKIETWHKPDLGEQENVHGLDPEDWKEVEVLPIDIADRSMVYGNDYKSDEDPAIFKSVKTGRGPLGPSWKKDLLDQPDCPHMCAYKLVTVNFHWWGLQGRVEKFIHKQEKRLFTNFHRQLFCWIDKWIGLTMDDIRQMEEDTQKELLQIRHESTLRGMSAKDE